MKTLKTITLAVSLIAAPLISATATPFTPVIDEFWVVKNGVENFRDSFNDGVLPASEPEDGITTSGTTYTTQGAAGFTGESGGKLTMMPSLGSPTLITGVAADTFTGARRLRSTNPASSAHLGFGDSFEIHGLFDMSSIPEVTGQSFGIRASDRSLTNGANDVMQLSLGRSPITGDRGIRFAELDFIGDSNDTAGFISIESFLPSADQLELIISKAANTDVITASFFLYDSSGTILIGGNPDNVNNVTLQTLNLYNGENYTRPQFFATDTGVPIPAPASALIFALGLAALGLARRKGTI